MVDFRALRDVCVPLDPGTTVLVGENNTGKSTFLEALATAMGVRAAVPDDMHIDAEGRQSQSFCIDLLLLPQEGNHFSEHLAPLLADAIRQDHTRQDTPEFVAVRTVGTLGTDRSLVERRRCFIDGWTGCDGGTGTEVVEIPGIWVTERHLALISFTLLQAGRDLVAEMRRRSSRWGRLLSQRDLTPDMENTIESRLRDLGELVLENSPLLGRLRDRLDEAQEAMPTVEHVELEPLPSRIDDLTRATDVLVRGPKGPRLPIRMQGLGSRSLAELMVYRAFAEELVGTDEPYSPHAVACFEEPEAHLHPQAQLALMSILDQMSGQRIVTTHSPQIASEADIRRVRLFRSSGADIKVSMSRSLTDEELIKLRRLAERPLGQVLFARLVIIGDGATERAALPIFARAHWGIDPEGKGVSFVDPLSLGQAPPLIGLLDELGIPWLVFADGDQGGHEALKAIRKRLRRSLSSFSDRVIELPSGKNFEDYLVGQGRQEAIRQGIEDLYGSGSLTYFARSLGMSSVDGDTLLIKFLDGNKGTYGAAVARAIVANIRAAGQPQIPELIVELLDRADRILGVDKP